MVPHYNSYGERVRSWPGWVKYYSSYLTVVINKEVFLYVYSHIHADTQQLEYGIRFITEAILDRSHCVCDESEAFQDLQVHRLLSAIG